MRMSAQLSCPHLKTDAHNGENHLPTEICPIGCIRLIKLSYPRFASAAKPFIPIAPLINQLEERLRPATTMSVESPSSLIILSSWATRTVSVLTSCALIAYGNASKSAPIQTTFFTILLVLC